MEAQTNTVRLTVRYDGQVGQVSCVARASSCALTQTCAEETTGAACDARALVIVWQKETLQCNAMY